MSAKKQAARVTDKAHMAQYAEYDKAIPTMSGHFSDLMRLKCKTCGSGPRHVMSFYAFTRGENWRLITCHCHKKLVWFELTGVRDVDSK